MNIFFRRDALKKLSQQEELNKRIVITPSYSWIAIVTGIALVVLFAIWGFCGRIEHTRVVKGMYMDFGDNINVSAGCEGIVEQIYIDQTTFVITKGEELFRIRTEDGKHQIIRSEYDGILDSIEQELGNYVTKASRLCVIRNLEGYSYVNMLLPLSAAPDYTVGMKVKVTCESGEAGNQKAVDGEIIHISNSIAKDDAHNREIFGTQISETFEKENYVIARCVLDEEDAFFDHTIVRITTTSGYVSPFELLFGR